MPLQISALAPLGSHHSRPGRNSPPNLRCLESKVVFSQSLGFHDVLINNIFQIRILFEQRAPSPSRERQK